MEFEKEHHSDPLDVSVAQQERILAAQLSVRKPEGPAATGFCLYCGEQVTDDDIVEYIRAGNKPPPGVRKFCDINCSKDYDKYGPA